MRKIRRLFSRLVALGVKVSCPICGSSFRTEYSLSICPYCFSSIQYKSDPTEKIRASDIDTTSISDR